MRFLTLLALSVVLLAPLAAAQGGPASQLDKFDKTLGTWHGEGAVIMTPGAPEMPWTATITATKILDGHFIQEDMMVDIGMGSPMVWRSIYGWDATKNQYNHFAVDNMGGVNVGTTYWASGGKLVSSNTMEEEGQIVTDHHVVSYSGDSLTIKIDRAVAGGDFFTHVQGTFKRKDDKPFVALAASFETEMAPPVAPEIQKLNPMIGLWKIKARMAPAPGAPNIDVMARQETRQILGGHALFSELIGDATPDFPVDYRAHYYQAWDPTTSRLVGLWISNMGEAMEDESYVTEDGKIISINHGMYQGAPTASRGLTIPDGKGGWIMQGWSIAGDGKPEMSFEGKMTRIED